jgi:CHAT domain-containing protein
MPSVPTPSGGRARLQPLPGAEAEGEWVGAFLGADALLGPEATEWDVRVRLPEAPIVHLATHGYAYATPVRARESYVALAPSLTEDGVLTVREILDDLPTLSADLVVLSACQTGLGDVKRSEGTVGLQRAFLAKGARSVLVSLWNVDDQATALLMRRFYTHWRSDADGPGKAEALRRAQQDVRSTAGFEHPRYWAGFQLVGAG